MIHNTIAWFNTQKLTENAKKNSRRDVENDLAYCFVTCAAVVFQYPAASNMISLAARQIIEAFDRVDKKVRLEEIAKGVLPDVEIDFQSDSFPIKWKKFDTDGEFPITWAQLAASERESIYSEIEGNDECSPSSVRFLLTKLLRRSTPPVSKPPPVSLPLPKTQPQPVPRAILLSGRTPSKSPLSSPSSSPCSSPKTRNVFPSHWVPADASGKLRRMWMNFTDNQRIELRRIARATVHRTGVEAAPLLTQCFEKVRDLQTVGTAASLRPVPVQVVEIVPRANSVPIPEKPLVEDELQTRTIFEVMNVRLNKADNSVIIQVKYNADGDLEWIDAGEVVTPHVLELLRSALAKIKY